MGNRRRWRGFPLLVMVRQGKTIGQCLRLLDKDGQRGSSTGEKDGERVSVCVDTVTNRQAPTVKGNVKLSNGGKGKEKKTKKALVCGAVYIYASIIARLHHTTPFRLIPA